MHPDYVPHRVCPPAWQAELEAIVPRSDRVSWLKIAWHPGIFYSPLSRWVIYELEPNLDRIGPEILADIQGASPRSRGSWVPDPSIPESLGGHRWVSDSLHSLTQWELFRATNCYPVLFWIIQGHNGGHVWRLDRIKQRFMLAINGTDVPNPGDLPYAEWDQRVAQQIIRYDRLRKWTQARAWDSRGTTRTDAGLIVHKEAFITEQQYTDEMLKWLDGQIHDAVSDLPASMVPAMSDLPVVPGVDAAQGIEQSTQALLASTGHAPWEE